MIRPTTCKVCPYSTLKPDMHFRCISRLTQIHVALIGVDQAPWEECGLPERYHDFMAELVSQFRQQA